MRILILGTSNSILKDGYVPGLRRTLAPHAEIINASIGNSPGLQFAGWCAGDLSSFDYVIFDSVVNDENTLWFMDDEFQYYSKIMFEMFSTIASQTQLVVIGFCTEKYLSDPSDIYKLQKRMALQLGGLFLSAREFAIERQYAPCFMDEQHIHPAIAYEFGVSMASRLDATRRTFGKCENFSKNFSVIDLAKVHPGQVVRRANRRIAQDFLCMRVGNVVEFDPVRRAIGFYIDAKNTSGFLRVANSAQAWNMGLFYEIDEEKFLVRFISIKLGMLLETMTAIELCEDWEAARGSFPECRTERMQICISRVVCWNPG